MQNIVEFAGHVHKFAYIVVVKLKFFEVEQVFNIFQGTGNQVIHGNYMVAFFQEPVAEVRA